MSCSQNMLSPRTALEVNDEMEVRIKHSEFNKLIEEKIKDRMTSLKLKNNEIIETTI